MTMVANRRSTETSRPATVSLGASVGLSLDLSAIALAIWSAAGGVADDVSAATKSL